MLLEKFGAWRWPTSLKPTATTGTEAIRCVSPIRTTCTPFRLAQCQHPGCGFSKATAVFPGWEGAITPYPGGAQWLRPWGLEVRGESPRPRNAPSRQALGKRTARDLPPKSGASLQVRVGIVWSSSHGINFQLGSWAGTTPGPEASRPMRYAAVYILFSILRSALGFLSGIQSLPVEQFISGHSVKTHQVAIFPRTAWLDGEPPETNKFNIQPKNETLVRFDLGLVVFWWNLVPSLFIGERF